MKLFRPPHSLEGLSQGNRTCRYFVASRKHKRCKGVMKNFFKGKVTERPKNASRRKHPCNPLIPQDPPSPLWSLNLPPAVGRSSKKRRQTVFSPTKMPLFAPPVVSTPTKSPRSRPASIISSWSAKEWPARLRKRYKILSIWKNSKSMEVNEEASDSMKSIRKKKRKKAAFSCSNVTFST